MQSSSSQNTLPQGQDLRSHILTYKLTGDDATDKVLNRLNANSEPMFQRYSEDDLPGIAQAFSQIQEASRNPSSHAFRRAPNDKLEEPAEHRPETERVEASGGDFGTFLETSESHGETDSATPSLAPLASDLYQQSKVIAFLGLKVSQAVFKRPRLSEAINLLNSIEGPLTQASCCQKSSSWVDGRGDISMDAVFKDLNTVFVGSYDVSEGTGPAGPYPKQALLRNIKALGKRYARSSLHSPDPTASGTRISLNKLQVLVAEYSELDDDTTDGLNSASTTPVQPSTVPESQDPSSTNQLDDVGGSE